MSRQGCNAPAAQLARCLRARSAHHTEGERQDHCSNGVKVAACAGDDDGKIQLWDLRQAEAVGSFAEHTDYISDMAVHAPERALLACSGDGTLSVNDLRTFRVGPDEGLSIPCFREGRAVLRPFDVGSLPLVEGNSPAAICRCML